MERKKATLRHRDRKNPGRREYYAKLRRAANAARGKQVWNEILEAWERIPAAIEPVRAIVADPNFASRVRYIESAAGIS